MIIELLVIALTIAGQWMYFKKMGREGWEAIIPIYSTYVLFEELYGNGWKMLLALIPVYNIYLLFKLNIDLARAFNLNTGFGIGLTVMYPIFACMLGFGDAHYYGP